MSQRVNQRSTESLRSWSIPALWAVIVTVGLSTAFRTISWAFVDLYNHLYVATTRTWPETLVDAFARGVEYRPLMTILFKLSHQLVGLRLWAYQLLVILQFAAILGLLIWLFKPDTPRRAAAACVAICCVAGLHTSRVLFMFAPLNIHSMGVVLLLGAAAFAVACAEQPRLRSLEWLLLPWTFVALLLLESGALVVCVVAAVLLAARGSGALSERVGLTYRSVAASGIALVVYVAIRFAFGSQAGPVATYAETGLGFSDVPADRLAVIFGEAPWLLWLYNVAASFLTVVASEPRAGRFTLTETLLHGNTPAWMWFHFATSVVTTIAVACALIAFRPFTGRDRFLVAVGLTLVVAGSGLGFLYTRERIALSAGVGYAMLVFVAASALLSSFQSWRRSVAAALVSVMGVMWTVRTAEAWFQLRDTAWESHLEWTERYESLAGDRTQTDLLVMLREGALARTPADPRQDPAWTYVLFERQYPRASVPGSRFQLPGSEAQVPGSTIQVPGSP